MLSLQNIDDVGLLQPENARIIAFLYLLMRDDIVSGQIHKILINLSKANGDENIFSNPFIVGDAAVCLYAIQKCLTWKQAYQDLTGADSSSSLSKVLEIKE